MLSSKNYNPRATPSNATSVVPRSRRQFRQRHFVFCKRTAARPRNDLLLNWRQDRGTTLVTSAHCFSFDYQHLMTNYDCTCRTILNLVHVRRSLFTVVVSSPLGHCQQRTRQHEPAVSEVFFIWLTEVQKLL